MEISVKGDLILGKARVILQDAGELTPRVTECDVIVANTNFSKRFKRLVRKFGGYFALILLASALNKNGVSVEHHLPMVVGAISSAIATSFKAELGTATHNFTNGTGNTFKCALYTSAATLGAATTAYSATNEVSGAGYSAGGTTIVSSTPVTSGTTAIYDFTDAQWTTATITANGCLVYNSSAANRAIFVIAFGADQTVSAGTFTIQWPTADASNAILRLS